MIRIENVDNKENFEKIIKITNYLSKKLCLFFPIHPRTKKNLEKFNLEDQFLNENISLSEPIGYLDFLSLMSNSKLILTDSGGIQEEASYLNIPILTLRKNTERPITVEKGTNTVIGADFKKAKQYIDEILANKYKKGQKIEKWDGKTSDRIIEIFREKLFE